MRNQTFKLKLKHMKKILKLSFIAICILSLTNCNKEETENLVSEIDVTINNSDDYEIDLMISGDEEGATIKTQAQHFQKSELIRDSSTNWSVVYQYEPLSNYTGMDFVEIETCTGGESTGCSNFDIVRINFNITN
jgi:hypothetical protein